MKPPEQDRNGQELLDQLDDLQSGHKMHGEEPPLMIDQAVRNMARRAIQTPASRKLPRLGWIAGLSTASVALIALGISLVQAPKSSLPPLKPSSETMSTEQNGFRENRDIEGGRMEMRSPSVPVVSGAPARKAGRPAAAAAQAVEMPAENTALEEQSKDYIEADLADSVQKQKQQAPEDDREVTAWLDLIRQLQEQGLQSEALSQLVAFKAAHPGVALPAWARELEMGLETEPGSE